LLGIGVEWPYWQLLLGQLLFKRFFFLKIQKSFKKGVFKSALAG
jgi:hypothetical protein